MQVLYLWNRNRRPTISFEIFPARSEKGAKKLDQVIDDLAGLKPDFVSVTFGAGGSTRDGSPTNWGREPRTATTFHLW